MTLLFPYYYHFSFPSSFFNALVRVCMCISVSFDALVSITLDYDILNEIEKEKSVSSDTNKIQTHSCTDSHPVHKHTHTFLSYNPITIKNSLFIMFITFLHSLFFFFFLLLSSSFVLFLTKIISVSILYSCQFICYVTPGN